MTSLRIGLLRMTELDGPARAVHGGYLDVFSLFFADHPVELVDIAVHEGDAPASVTDCDGWVITGSPASVYDDHDWIRGGEEIVRAAVAEERPLIGICFGHQLVAQALGGTVEKAESGWGVGARSYETVHPIDGITGTTTVLAAHQDQVTVAPSDAVVWSTAGYCPVAGMLIGERAMTIQAHPEFTPALASAIYHHRCDLIGAAAVDEAMATLSNPLSTVPIADSIVNFVRD